ncbi:DHA1 family inner membrane transport protein [Bradyrhizobium sp. GM24.11]
MHEPLARPSSDQKFPPAINIIALASFSAALSTRALDPVLPHVAEEFSISITTAASIAAGYALIYALIQPIVGAAADLFGKARLMTLCLALLGVACILGALSTSFSGLFASRMLAGIASGGVFPVALGLTADLVAPAKRQVAIGRTLAGSMTGNLLGATASGIIGDLVGWRGVLVIIGALGLIAAVAVAAGFRGAALSASPKSDLKTLRQGYRTILANPNARYCYSAVFVEGCCVFGLFPFIAALLFDLGETSLSIAGIVIAGFAVGGLFYTFTVSRFLPRLGVKGMMIAGASLVALQLAALALGARLEGPIRHHAADGLGLLHDPWLLAGVRQRAVGRRAGDGDVAALVLFLHGPDGRSARLWVRACAHGQGADPGRECRAHGAAGPCLRRAAQAAGTVGRADLTKVFVRLPRYRD